MKTWRLDGLERWQKVLVGALAAYVGLALVIGVVLGLWVVRAGWASLTVASHDLKPARIHLVVPIALAEAGLSIAGRSPAGVSLRADLRDYDDVLPALEALGEGLEEMPDCELVKVRQGAESIVVRKVHGRMQVEVEADEGDQVRVEAPARSVRRIVRRLERIVQVDG